MPNTLYLSGQIAHILKRIRFYRQMYFSTPDFGLKMYYENLITNELFWLEDVTFQYEKLLIPNQIPDNTLPQQLKEYTLEELALYDGSQGRPAYVAVNGLIYDLSTEATWGGGTHFGLKAGRDLSRQFAGCHSMQPILNQLAVVGVLKTP